MQLESVSPAEAVELYIEERSSEVSKNTLYAHRNRLTRFLEWVDETRMVGVMSEMTRQKAHRYKVYRSELVAPTTLEHEMRTFRLFLDFCERLNFCPEGVAKNFKVPSAPKSRRSRNVKLDPGRAETIEKWLGKYEYASFRHVLFHLMWYMGARTGGIRAMDLEDFHETSPDGPYLDFVHRPETGTPLKNDWKSERMPPIGDQLCELLQDYIENNRPDVTDKHGREPLLATKYGRPSQSTIQRTIYSLTQPCLVGECPHDSDPSTCEATGDYNKASQCPSSRSRHALRRGRATKNLNEGMPEEMVGDRMDMTPEVLREHYNEQSEADKRRLQRQFLDV